MLPSASTPAASSTKRPCAAAATTRLAPAARSARAAFCKVVPVAIRGTSWIRFRGRVTIAVGNPIEADGRATRDAVDRLTRATQDALAAMVREAPDVPIPGRVGRWLTEAFNDWPEGSREATLAAGAAHRTVPD